MIAFHEHPRAFARLTPPPIFVQMHRNALKSLTEGEVEFTLWFGPIPARWIAPPRIALDGRPLAGSDPFPADLHTARRIDASWSAPW